jgi:flagellar basal-body rod protein FlgG
MLKAMKTAATGMMAQQMNVDNIANNLANVNTTGFKKGRVEFQDILYENLRRAGTSAAVGSVIPVSLDVGYGSRAVATTREFTTGSYLVTGNPTDMAIAGNGFFQVRMPDGTTGYSRDGSFKLSAEGQIVTADGFALLPEVTVPQDATDIAIGLDGQVSVLITGNDTPQQIGQLELARFINPAGLSAVGHNIYNQTAASGSPITATPGTEGVGTITQGSLESSNVSVVDEMVNMIVAQRAYEINSKVIQTSDDMSQTVNNLKR